MNFSDTGLLKIAQDAKMAQIPKIGSNSLSCKIWLYKVGLTPQNDHKTRFTIVIFTYMYLSDNRKCPKNAKKAQISKLGQNEVKIGHKLISREPLAI